MELPFDPAIPYQGISKVLKTGTQTDICTSVFIAAVFTVAKRWKCPSGDGWINKMCHKHTMEYFSAVGRMKFWYMLQQWWTLKASF